MTRPPITTVARGRWTSAPVLVAIFVKVAPKRRRVRIVAETAQHNERARVPDSVVRLGRRSICSESLRGLRIRYFKEQWEAPKAQPPPANR